MSKNTTKLFHLLVVFLMVPSYVPVTLAQTPVTGAVQGRVYDVENNNPVAGAFVRAKNQDTGLVRTSLTRVDGSYLMLNLPAGAYEITATATGYEPIPNSGISSVSDFPISITSTTSVSSKIIGLRKIGSSSSSTTTASGAGTEGLVNTVNATRGGSFDRQDLLSLPLPGIRTFDDLAFLLPGVAPPPLAIGSTVGPGIGPGVGTSGQFSVNGLRSRSNNFTIDGSDNNDEDVGVRRQGFTSLVPQTIESVQEFQVSTALPEPQVGRYMGAQVNAVSRSGSSELHGTVYGFLTDSRLKARDVFDFTGGPETFPILSSRTGDPVWLNSKDLEPRNQVGDEDPYTRVQSGFALGGPVVKEKMHFFFALEHQDINASKESHFAVPTVKERGLFDSGDIGLAKKSTRERLFPTSIAGDAFFSFFPFPNNPFGPYRDNTYTEVLPADADGIVFSTRLDNNIGDAHTLSARYNFTDDDTILPVTGEALFSSLRALVRTQNLSLNLNSSLSPRMTNEFRFSAGRTSLAFEEVRNSFLIESELFPGEDMPFLLNAPIVFNGTTPKDVVRQGGQNKIIPRRPKLARISDFGTELVTGPLGQLIVSGYSPVGVDVYNFPQERANNSFQMADTFFYDMGNHRLTAGFDIRRLHLNSRIDRNFRPVAVFSAALDFSNFITDSQTDLLLNLFDPDRPAFLFGRDYVAAGAPTSFFHTQSLNPDSTLGLRQWQSSLFFSDQIHVRRNLTLTLGLRYDFNTVPTDVHRRIEDALVSPELEELIKRERKFMKKETGQAVSGIEEFLDNRRRIYREDTDNFAPHFSFAWDPFGKSKTAIRGGYGIYYDQIPGAVISQSRSVFPNFITLNLAGLTNAKFGRDREDENFPGRLGFIPTNRVTSGMSLNVTRFADLVGLLIDATGVPGSGAGPAFVLPVADLQTPYAQHWALSLEHEIHNNFTASIAYVGTRGLNLLRLSTPNLGPNLIPVIKEITEDPEEAGSPVFTGKAREPGFGGRPFPLLGALTAIDSDASSIYHSLQLQLNKRFSRGVQLTTAYTWSHAIDEVSDIFDLSGTRSLPQDSFNLAAERGDANFDIRQRFVYSLIWDIPLWQRHNILGGWQVASIGTFQTGQPYSVLFCCDVNLDGNLTDRVSATDFSDLGIAGRNTFRAPGIATVDMTLNKRFRLGERQNIEFRTEVFNIFNRTHFGIPVHQLFSHGFAGEPLTEQHFVDTRLAKRTIQFALKFNF